MAISTEDIIKQVEWEEDAAESAVEAAIKSVRKSTGENSLLMTLGVDWLDSHIETLSKAVFSATRPYEGKSRKSSAETLFCDLDPKDIAMVMLSHAARACISKKAVTYNSFVCSVGLELSARAAYEGAKSRFEEEMEAIGVKSTPEKTVRWIADHGIEVCEASRDTAKIAGAQVCQVLIDCGIIAIERSGRSDVVVADSISGLLESNLAQLVQRAHEARPTIIPPKPWKYDGHKMDGGFYGAGRINRSHMIRTDSFVQQRINETWSTMKPVVEAVNILQGVEWSIDRRVFDVAYAMSNSLSDGEKLMLSAAEDMLGHEKHYHVWTADYRYRLYSEAGLINPQGGDLQKSLLRAYKGKPIGTDPEVVRFFKIGVAGKFGVDNVSIPERIEWLDAHHELIIRSARNPLAEQFWLEAEKPWQFLQVCFEYAGWADNPEGFVATVVATPLDGKCSGIQHFSAMGRDPIGAKATCLAANKEGDAPNDIYNDVRDIVQREVEAVVAKASRKKFSHLWTDEEKLAKAWLDCGIDRGDVKRSVMTMPYSATERACFEQILMSLSSKGKMPEQAWEAARMLQPVLWGAIPKVVRYARNAMDWLKASAGDIVRHGADNGKPWIEFKNPNGAIVYQMCWKNKTTKIAGRHVHVRVNRADRSKVDIAKHKLGMSPNFIHSCDAAHMHNVIRRMGRGTHLHVIHDSFGVLPADTPELYRVVREEFCKLYSYFGLHTLRDSYPFLSKPPRRGSFDINEVMSAEFAFL